ncbi:unnamed protein product [Brassica oleracea var. botrytis]|uniref:(rape) hypothetical protein n=1 Tax=Brassica napus TaxID=3708 RepID=A0A816LLS6_BRANA|nr:unnamed protein product [Brassica napus]
MNSFLGFAGLRATPSFDQTLDLCPQKRPKILLLFSTSGSQSQIFVSTVFLVHKDGFDDKVETHNFISFALTISETEPSGHGEFTNPSLQIEAKAQELKSFTFSKDLKSKDTSVRES